MTRPDHLLTCALLLGSLLLPGCVHTKRRSDPDDVELPTKSEPPRKTADWDRDPSPYHLRPRVDAVARRDRPRGEVIERVNYPEPPPRPAPLPERREAAARLLLPVDEPPPVKKVERPAKPPEPTKLPEPAPAPEEPAVGALRCYMQRKPDEAGKLLDSYDRPTREALLCLLPLAARYTQGHTTGPGAEDVPDLVDRMHGLTDPLRRKEPLRVDRLTFCRQIQHFGVYDPLPDPRPSFQAGCEGQPGGMMLVYAEVRNFVSQPRPPEHVTALASRAEIRDRNDTKVWEHPFGTNEDKSRTPRQDYFITYTLCVPCGLAPGDYKLWIEVADMQSKPARKARRSLDFSVVGSATAQGGRGKPVARVSRGSGVDEATDQ